MYKCATRPSSFEYEQKIECHIKPEDTIVDFLIVLSAHKKSNLDQKHIFIIPE